VAYSLAPVAARLVTILTGLSGLSAAAVGYGPPMTLDQRITAWVSVGSQPTTPKTTGIMARDSRLFVLFEIRIDGDQAAAELLLMPLIDAFMAAIYVDLTLAGTCRGVELDTGLSESPEYQVRAGKAVRQYPVIVTVRQYAPHNV
jgi:hypothetical protein